MPLSLKYINQAYNRIFPKNPSLALKNRQHSKRSLTPKKGFCKIKSLYFIKNR